MDALFATAAQPAVLLLTRLAQMIPGVIGPTVVLIAMLLALAAVIDLVVDDRTQ